MANRRSISWAIPPCILAGPPTPVAGPGSPAAVGGCGADPSPVRTLAGLWVADAAVAGGSRLDGAAGRLGRSDGPRGGTQDVLTFARATGRLHLVATAEVRNLHLEAAGVASDEKAARETAAGT